MSISKFQIVFDRPSKNFKSNQAVTGNIYLNLNATKQMRALVVHMLGEASILWQETKETKNSEGNTVYETVNYTGNEVYFENKYNAVGGPSGEVTVQPGEYCYPFNVFLPPNLPNSFEGKFGKVKYTVKAIIDCPRASNSETVEKFTVICPFDLKEHKNVQEPVQKTKEHFFCCCCCKSGPLTIVTSVPASGYVSGQELPITVEVDNISQEEISKTTATLKQCITYHSTSPSKSVKSETTEVTSVDFGSVGQNGSETWSKSISIPLLPASDLQYCSLIDIKYELEVVAKVAAMCHSNVTVKIPITIGTVPLEGVTIPDEFIFDDVNESNVQMVPNMMNLESGQGLIPSHIGFQVPPGSGIAAPVPVPGHVQPVYPPFSPTPGMQQPNMYMPPTTMGIQSNIVGGQPVMPPYLGGAPLGIQQQMGQQAYNTQMGNMGQPNMGMTSPQHMQYQPFPSNIPAVHGHLGINFPSATTNDSYQNASAPPPM